MRIIVALLTLSFVFACKNHKNMESKHNQISRIEYHYSDSSVPPPYHRSYDIVVEPEKIFLTVDSYGEILTDTSFSLASGDFHNICDSLPAFNLKSRERVEPDGCVGGTGEQIKVYNEEGEIILDGSAYYCGGKTYGTLTGDLKGFGSLLKSYIPEFRKHLKD